MEATNRIIVNTAVQYVRSAIYMVLMLLTTRYVLAALGHSDYGVYSVVAGTVIMMSFITLSLAASTQRFISVALGTGDKASLARIFSNAIILHAAIALAFALLMSALCPLFMSFLKLPVGRYSAATFVYFMVMLMLLLSIMTAPVRALFIARENIIYVSIVEVIDGVLKLLGVLALPLIPYDSLRIYALIMVFVAIFNLLAYAIFALRRYEECHFPRPQEYSYQEVRRLTSFAVWNVYAVGSTAMRTQGLAMVINHFLGTLINAAYGIAIQASNAVGFIVLSIVNSINPQLMKAEGAGERQQMLMLCTKESKYSFLILSLLLIPIIVEMPTALAFWLGAVPDYATMFCRLLLIDYIIDQLTIGISSANQATGHIRNYTLLTCTLRYLVPVAAWGCLTLGYSPLIVMIVNIVFTIIINIIRVPYLAHTAGLNAKTYIRETLLRSLPIVIGLTLVATLLSLLPPFPLRFLVTEVGSIIIGFALVLTFSINTEERAWIVARFKHFKR